MSHSIMPGSHSCSLSERRNLLSLSLSRDTKFPLLAWVHSRRRLNAIWNLWETWTPFRVRGGQIYSTAIEFISVIRNTSMEIQSLKNWALFSHSWILNSTLYSSGNHTMEIPVKNICLVNYSHWNPIPGKYAETELFLQHLWRVFSATDKSLFWVIYISVISVSVCTVKICSLVAVAVEGLQSTVNAVEGRPSVTIRRCEGSSVAEKKKHGLGWKKIKNKKKYLTGTNDKGKRSEGDLWADGWKIVIELWRMSETETRQEEVRRRISESVMNFEE